MITVIIVLLTGHTEVAPPPSDKYPRYHCIVLITKVAKSTTFVYNTDKHGLLIEQHFLVSVLSQDSHYNFILSGYL